MRELQSANDVTHRIEVWFRRLHLGINLDEAALHRGLGLLKPNLAAIRHATSGYNKEVCTQRDYLSPVDRLNLQIHTASTFGE